MQTLLWVSGIGMVVWGAWVVFKALVRRGGWQVKLVDPRSLVIVPAELDPRSVPAEPDPEIVPAELAQEIVPAELAQEIVPAELAQESVPGDAVQAQARGLVGRFVPLQGAVNFRDIGGYLTESGRRVQMGRIFRSDELGDLTDADLSTLMGLGMRRILDLRSRDEVRKKGDRIPTDAPYQYLHTPVYEKEPRWDYLPAILFRRHQLGQVLSERYYFMVEKRAEVLARILAYFADLKNLPAVYHCNAGKDRTGIVTALVLSLLGVPDETIVADYSLSNLGFEHYFREFVEDRRHAALGVADEEFQGLFIVQPAWMRDLLAHLRETYGSVEAYLVEKGKMPPGVIEQIRANLLV